MQPLHVEVHEASEHGNDGQPLIGPGNLRRAEQAGHQIGAEKQAATEHNPPDYHEKLHGALGHRLVAIRSMNDEQFHAHIADGFQHRQDHGEGGGNPEILRTDQAGNDEIAQERETLLPDLTNNKIAPALENARPQPQFSVSLWVGLVSQRLIQGTAK